MHDRSKFIGGSDIGPLFGVSKRLTRAELWLEKTGRKEPWNPTPQEQRRLDRGKKLEPFVLDMVLDKLREQGHAVELVATNKRYQDPVFPFMSCEIDYELMVDGEHVNGDTKTAGFRMRDSGWGAEGTDEIPAAYAGQFYWGQGITARRATLVSALIGLDDVKLYWLPFHAPTVAAVRSEATRFWTENVLGDMPPAPSSYDDISQILKQDDGQQLDATEEIRAAVERLRALKDQAKELIALEETLKLGIATYLGVRSELMWQGQKIASWKTQGSSRIDIDMLRDKYPDVAAACSVQSTQRVMRLHNPKVKK